MLDSEVFEQRREKVAEALELAKMQMMTPEEETVRPWIEKIKLVERSKPEDTVGAIAGANQIPFSLTIPAEPFSYSIDLVGSWIDEIHPDAFIPWIKEWVTLGHQTGKLQGTSNAS